MLRHGSSGAVATTTARATAWVCGDIPGMGFAHVGERTGAVGAAWADCVHRYDTNTAVTHHDGDTGHMSPR